MALAERRGVDMAADNQFLVDVVASQVIDSAWPQGSGVREFDRQALLAASSATAAFSFGMLKPVVRAEFARSRGLPYAADTGRGQGRFEPLQFFRDGGTAVLSDRPLYFHSQPIGATSRQWSRVSGKRHPLAQVHAAKLALLKLVGRLQPRVAT